MKRGLEKEHETIDPPRQRTLYARDVDLIPFRLEDADETYHGWLNDDEVIEYLEVRFADRSMAALRTYVNSVIADPNRYFYLVKHRQTGKRIGTVSFTVNPIHLTVNWGYLIGDHEFWGTGISLQVQIPIFDFAFGELGARRFYGGAFIENIRSQFNLRRLGFIKEGVFRKHYRKAVGSEEFTDIVYYALLAEEWQSIRTKFDKFRIPPDNAPQS